MKITSLNKRHFYRLSFSFAASLFMANFSIASQGSNTLEEVIITARKDASMLQSTGVAVSAITEEQLKISQILDITGLQYTTPNLTISKGSPGAANLVGIGLRGQTSLDGTLTSDPAIATYVNGVYIARPHASLAEMIDVGRIEVLRGPQGTLFGRNTTGGALLVTSNEPTNELEGSISIQAGNYDHREFTGVLNMPVTNDLATRIVYQHSEHSGYGKNKFLDVDLNDKDSDFFRGSLKYDDPDGRWNLNVIADYTKSSNKNGQLVVLTGSPVDPDPASASFPLLVPNGTSLAREFFSFNGLDLNNYLNSSNEFWSNYSNEDEYFDFKGRGVSTTLNVDLDWAEIKYIGAWRDVDNEGFNDSDGTPLRLLSTALHNKQKQWSHELQISGSADVVSWIAGFSWFQEEATELTNSINYAGGFGLLRFINNANILGIPLPPGVPNLPYDPSLIAALESTSENNADATNTSKGTFGQMYIDLTDEITLTTGARYTEDTREVVLKNFNDSGICINAENDAPGICAQTRKTDFEYWSYLVGLDWQISENAFVYIKTSQSYLAGGFNNRGGAEPAFNPEKVNDIEIGAKLDWLDNRLRTNIAIFQAKQKGIQRSISYLNGSSIVQAITNAGSATVKGAEFELDAILWEGMTVKASLGMLDAEYDTFTETRGTATNPILVDRTNEDLPQVPELTYSIGATQEFYLSMGRLLFHIDYAFRDEVLNYTQTASPGSSTAVQNIYAGSMNASKIESYSLINAKVSLELNDCDLIIDLWGRNLGDEEYYARTFADLYTTPLSYSVGYPGDPKTYGISLTYNF